MQKLNIFEKPTWEEVDEYIIKRVKEAYEEFINCTVVRGELFKPTESNFMIKYFYDEPTDMVYLTFRVDPLAKSKYVLEALETILTAKIKNDFRRNMKREIVIIPTELSRAFDMNKNTIRPTTFTYWKNLDGSYYFIETRIEDTIIDYERFLIADHNNHKTVKDLEEYFVKLLKINNNYDFSYNNDSVPKGFEEYASLVKEYFGRELKPVNEDETRRIVLYVRSRLEE